MGAELMSFFLPSTIKPCIIGRMYLDEDDRKVCFA